RIERWFVPPFIHSDAGSYTFSKGSAVRFVLTYKIGYSYFFHFVVSSSEPVRQCFKGIHTDPCFDICASPGGVDDADRDTGLLMDFPSKKIRSEEHTSELQSRE